jgi:hypothetical protein
MAKIYDLKSGKLLADLETKKLETKKLPTQEKSRQFPNTGNTGTRKGDILTCKDGTQYRYLVNIL